MTSTELTGGAGFTYEDTVVAYYLAALLREERAAPLNSVVKSVSVQQGHNHPMDDIVVEFEEAGAKRTLGLQAKRSIRISAANKDFSDIISKAVATRATGDFNAELDAYGFVVEHVAVDRFRTLNRLIDWAKDSPSGEHFARHFAPDGGAASAECRMREDLTSSIGANSVDDEWMFYAQFVALRLDGLTEGGILRTEVVNRLQEIVASNEDGQDILLFDRLCRIARQASGTACKWTRRMLLAQLRGTVRLRVAPNYQHDLDLLNAFSAAGLADISEEIGGFRVERPALEDAIRKGLAKSRLVNISGLPGCGKSAMLKRIASVDAARGPIFFLKADRLEGNSWLRFAAALGLNHREVADLLAEISATGTSILYIDGIDRVRPDRRGIITDILRAVEEDDQLANWKVLASSRDQGLEAYRAWFPASFYRSSFIGDVSVSGFSDEEAKVLAEKRSNLSPLLFGPPSVREIARRPFFAAVLATSLPDYIATPHTEVDLIAAWWERAGHDSPEEMVPQRQHALLDLAEKGVQKLGKGIKTKQLKESTIAQIAGLKADFVIRSEKGGARFSFAHDIFFEWVFFRYLIELDDEWKAGLIKAGEPPLLGRVVGLLAQDAITTPGKWSTGYQDLEKQAFRSQWRREWLTAPCFTPAFAQGQKEFEEILTANDYALFEKFLVWFQAQHTVPSPIVLQNLVNTVEGVDPIGMAELISWPSDFESWGRVLDWLLQLAATLPSRLLPHVIEVFGVWQNVFAELKNSRSATIVEVCRRWLIDLDHAEYANDLTVEKGYWDALSSETRSGLATSLRMIVLRTARAYPTAAIALFDRAVANDRMRSKAYSDLMAFTRTMVDVAPESVVAVTKAELMEELPQDKVDRQAREHDDYLKRLKLLHAIPEKERTDDQKRALSSMYFPVGRDSYDSDDVGIDRYHGYYHPVSALHEPFATLFAKKPEVALGLVHDLANHATEGWRQIQLINRKRMGTPIPISVHFPWGKQEFWGDWHVYNWFMGQLAPQPLGCAFQALSYWAFNEIERGTPPGDVIRAVVEGNECYAALGLALVLALEAHDVSEASLPIVSCQRLWQHDIARVVQEPSRNIDLFGIGRLSRLTGDKAKAKAFLDSRESRGRDVTELAMRFALAPDMPLRERFREALARFPNDLPYEIEEHRSKDTVTSVLLERAEIWAGLGDIKNYRGHTTKDDEIEISYEPPKDLTPEQEQRLEGSRASLQEYAVIAWANRSLGEGKIDDKIGLPNAIAFARARDNLDVFSQRHDVGHSAQTVVSAVAAVVICLGPAAGPDCGWAWDVMSRVALMKEPQDVFAGSKIPWHPANHLVHALIHDRRSSSPHRDSSLRLLRLADHPLNDVAQFAFRALFADPNEHVRWVAAQLAMDLSVRYRAEIKENGEFDRIADQVARKQSLERAVERLAKTEDTELAKVPPPWVKADGRSRLVRLEEPFEWVDADPSFDPQFAAHLFPDFPIEAWCSSPVYKAMLKRTLQELVSWTAERLMPSWRREAPHGRRDRSTADLIEWSHVLGDLLARAAPFFETEVVRQEFLAPFLTQDEKGLAVLAQFAEMTVVRHVFDATEVPSNTLDLLSDCAERITRDRVFDPKRYRAGEVHGFDLPKLISALLFVGIDENAPGAARFANGDWSQVGLIMPIVTKLVTQIGWSTFVALKWATLCERAGEAYPVDAFASQANAVLGSIANAKGSWTGTLLPARIAAAVQRLADANFPLRADQAQQLLRVLDALIDLGDRRSASLEQTEAFKGVQSVQTSAASGSG